MTTEYSLEEIEALDRQWVDDFAAKRGWDEHHLIDPVEDLSLFFNHLSGTTMLDAGCGWGRYVHRFIDAGLTYIGLDHSCEMLLVAESNNPGLKFVQATFRKIPFPSEHFDGVWSCCTLAAIPKKYLVDILSEHKRVLKPGGVIMIMMPAVEGSSETMYTDDDGNPEIYQSHYDLDEFVEYVRGAGFNAIEANYRWHNGSMYVLAKKPNGDT